MKIKIPKLKLLTPALGLALLGILTSAQAADKKPNIIVIMGDDIGWFNIGAYHEGIMSGKTPNLDKLASQGMRFTDYYAELPSVLTKRSSSAAGIIARLPNDALTRKLPV